ncbi:glutamate-rich protein 2-like [Ischnura elegans]|uniref:glutamate-rich protein 2-like n=1 Tax=Ischnura elegans TaxID=197161 RepID=UPI001ED8A8FE|nr:glutamate-rich protein 2-like [Ischnura elegans]
MSTNNNNICNNNEIEDSILGEIVEAQVGVKNISNLLNNPSPSKCSSNLKEVIVVGKEEAGPSGETPTTFLSPTSSTTLTPRSSSEDLSEYTDADESISAPTEFLAEFLSAVMMRDFTTALKYCKLILQYEPNNAAAKEFYPLIIEKIKMMADESDSNSEVSVFEDNSDGTSVSGEKHSSEDSDATNASYSSLEDDEGDTKNCDNNDVKLGHLKIAVASDGNGNGSCIPSQNMPPKDLQQQDVPPFPTSSSDSESPTEPISQTIVNV